MATARLVACFCPAVKGTQMTGTLKCTASSSDASEHSLTNSLARGCAAGRGAAGHDDAGAEWLGELKVESDR